MTEIRLIPLVMIAAGSLLTLKAVGIIGGPMPATGTRPAVAQDISQPATVPSAQASRPLPTALDQNDPLDPGPLTTGSVPAPAAPAAPPPPAAASAPAQPPAVSSAERAILERLQERRQEIEQRGRELEMRENLLRAAERRIEQRATELKDLEARIAAMETRREEAEERRFKGVVSMYESMRARDAARIFDTLELSVLIEIARAMKPPKLADIMAAMGADPARRLSVEIAKRPGQPMAGIDPRQLPTNELPKIEGRPTR